MKPPPFSYVDPGTLPEALEALARHSDECKLLAGGQSLVPLLNMRLAQPAVLIDLNRVSELQYVKQRAGQDASGLAFGTVTRQRAVEKSEDALRAIPILRDAIGWIGHPQIRNRGTIGGSIAHADPAAELPLIFVCLDGIAEVQSHRGQRLVPAAEFFQYTFTTCIEPDEMLTEVWLPLPAPCTGQAFLEVARRHGDFALVSAAVSLTMTEHGYCSEVRIALGGVSPVPMRARAAEKSVRGQKASLHLFREAGTIAGRETNPTSDVHADVRYRRDVAGTLTYRALKLAFERAGRHDA